MKVSEFLRENGLSVGDNFRLLLRKLGFESDAYARQIEAKVGEPAKMSKSKGNTVDPEDAVKRYGADAVRLYILFAGPVEKDFEWTEEGLQGAYRFLRRLWDFTHKHLELLQPLDYSSTDFEALDGRPAQVRRKAHQTLKKYLQQMEEFSFNTAIAGIMELFNALQDFEPQGETELKVLKEVLEMLLFMLYPMTPHLCEELWQKMGKEKPILFYPFPSPDERALQVQEIDLPVQVNGKLRAVIKVPVDADEELVKEIALKDPRLSQWLAEKQPRKVIHIKNKLLNLVV